MIVFWIILGIVVVVGLALVVSYNRFVNQRQLIRNAFANIDTELRRRVALKVLDAPDAGVEARLRREAQVVAPISAPAATSVG